MSPLLGAGPAVAKDREHGQEERAGTTWGDARADKHAQDAYGRNQAKADAGSLFTVTTATGARAVWRQKDSRGRAVTGQGVTVAVIDSGVAAVSGLDAPGKIVRGPDLSLENNSDEPMDPDTYGHGTHMASIIGASDPALVAKNGKPVGTDASDELGMAPGSTLLALKLASTDGSTDVSQVIAALDWVVEHKDDNGMAVRVVNLSFGTTGLQDYQLDPLAAAAENAWRKGLVVVVSGGNSGRDSGGLTNPAIDPYVLAVGASDPRGSVKGWKDPEVASFSSRGTAARSVDLVAPGRSIVGLRAPGSYVDTMHPEGRVAGDTSGRLFRGSGTSQAAAVVSGAVALLLQAHPDLSPDAVKAALLASADAGTRLDSAVDAGAGQLDVDGAMAAIVLAKKGKDGAGALLTSRQSWPVAAGTGSLEAARGGTNLADPDTGLLLQGEVDVQGQVWDGATWAKASADGTAWIDGEWMRARWSGGTWSADGWARARWSGSSWTRARWSDAGWERARWSRARWSDAAWERARWS